MNNDLNNIFGEDAWYEPKSQGGGSSVQAGKYDNVEVKDLNIKKDIVFTSIYVNLK